MIEVMEVIERKGGTNSEQIENERGLLLGDEQSILILHYLSTFSNIR